MNIQDWRTEMEALLNQMSSVDLGYPQGENALGGPAEPASLAALVKEGAIDRSSKLCTFYQQCCAVELPDVHVGYFIHSPELILRGVRSGEPRRITGRYERAITVFGTDGGGGRFAVGAHGCEEILYLGEGEVQDAVFDGVEGQVRVIAASIEHFLNLLLADVRAFVRGDDWKFLV